MITTSKRTGDTAATPATFADQEQFLTRYAAEQRVAELAKQGINASYYHGHRHWVVRGVETLENPANSEG